MSNQIIKQPDGRFAVWSTITDGFILIDATPAEIVEEWLSDERARLTERVEVITDALDAGERPYHQFTESWEEALETYRQVHGVPFDLEAERAAGECDDTASE